MLRELKEKVEQTRPFCRHPKPKTKAEAELDVMKRIEANDPVAMCFMGTERFLEGDYDSAIKLFTMMAVGLGDAVAHHQLSIMYNEGIVGVEKVEKKGMHHLEESAIGGHPEARFNLACYEGINGRIDRAVKHCIIAANLGHDGAIQQLKDCYAHGDVSKEDFAAALRAHQTAVDATKSPHREAAEAARK